MGDPAKKNSKRSILVVALLAITGGLTIAWNHFEVSMPGSHDHGTSYSVNRFEIPIMPDVKDDPAVLKQLEDANKILDETATKMEQDSWRPKKQ
jgi:hypothetical protein